LIDTAELCKKFRNDHHKNLYLRQLLVSAFRGIKRESG